MSHDGGNSLTKLHFILAYFFGIFHSSNYGQAIKSNARYAGQSSSLHPSKALQTRQDEKQCSAGKWVMPVAMGLHLQFLIQNMAFQIRLNLTHAEHVHAWIAWAVGINAWMNVHFHGHNTCTHTKTQLLQCRQAQVLLYFLQMVVVLQTMVLLLLHSHRWDTCSAFKVTSIS